MITEEPRTENLRHIFPAYGYEGPLKRSIAIAEHYGFCVMKPHNDIPEGIEHDQEPVHKNVPHWYLGREDKFLGFKTYLDSIKEMPKPALLCSTLNARRKIGKLRLSVHGTKKGIAEALLLKTALAILTDDGKQNLCIDINSVGDKESRTQFLKEFIQYVKVHLNKLDVETQTLFKQDPLAFVFSEHESAREIRDNAPESLTFLSDEACNHLKEVIEYIESMNVPYRINRDLLGISKQHSSTFFQIKSLTYDAEGKITGEEIVCRGERSEDLSKIMGLRKAIPTVNLTIDLKAGEPERYTPHTPKARELPKIYFVHLGMEAKRKSLLVLELLRQKNIGVLQALAHDSLADQMAAARKLGIPYAVIMGVKEVKEESVIVRDMFTRSQETVAIYDLPAYLQKVVKIY